MAGGDINQAWKLELWRATDGARMRVFIKQNRAERAAMFAAEAAGLQALARNSALRIPAVLAQGVTVATEDTAASAYLVLEFITLARSEKADIQQLGQGLAAQHRIMAPAFGWQRDNTIGSTPQANAWTKSWAAFYRDQRLGPQLALAQRNGASSALLHAGERLCHVLPHFFTDYTPTPALLHGDLWGGNWGADETGMPVLFDPAVYYGDREAELAMTELFGGFPPGFYAAYNEAWPLDPGYRTRKDLYNLYHILNHFNLFGGGYAHQALHMTERLLAAIR